MHNRLFSRELRRNPNPRRRPMAKVFAVGMSAGLGAMAAVGWSAPPSAGKYNAASFALLGFAGNDGLYNYDFRSASAVASNTDWTANMMFRNNANINKVKGILEPQFRNDGNIMNAYLKDDAAYTWDTDKGMKNPNGASCPSDVHMRLYADSDDKMFNLTDGYYIFGTTHIDWLEGCSSESFGYSEIAEESFAAQFRNRGYTVSEDCCFWFNSEAPRVEENHHWDNNGYTTIVDIP